MDKLKPQHVYLTYLLKNCNLPEILIAAEIYFDTVTFILFLRLTPYVKKWYIDVASRISGYMADRSFKLVIL